MRRAVSRHQNHLTGCAGAAQCVSIGVVSGGAMTERDPAALMRFITTEIWCNRRYELVDELISDDFVDNIDAQALEGTGRSRYLASAQLVHTAFSDSREEAVFV